VYLDPEEISKAIGKRGVNIKLASKLTDFTIDVYREGYEGEEYDVELDEFKDEIEEWIIEALKSIGCDTARNVLELDKEELIRRTDLEDETVEEILNVLKAELEEDEKNN
jgi:N utilization substance protein A